MPGRFAYAAGLAILAAIQASIFSLPVSFWYGMNASRAPRTEFAGIAVFGTVLVAGAITATTVLIIAFVVVLIFYSTGSPFYPRAVRALLLSSASGIAALGAAFVAGVGVGWAVALSILAFVIAIIYVMRGQSGKIDYSV